MKNYIIDFKKSIRTELIKKKRSGIFILSFIIGIIFPLIGFIFNIVKHLKAENVAKGIPFNYYFYYLKQSLDPFAEFFFPVLIIYSASKIAQLDHKNKGWYLMETLPLTKFSLYFSKFFILITSNLIAITTLLISTFLFVFLESIFFDIPPHKLLVFPFSDFLEVGLRLFVVGLCIAAFQYVLSVLISSFIWPIIIGFILVLIPLALSRYSHLLTWYPYQLFSHISKYPKGSEFGNWLTFSEIIGLLYTMLFLYVGFNWYRFKKLITAFSIHKYRLYKLLGILIVGGVSIYFMLKTKQEEPYKKTIIQGEVASDRPINYAMIYDVVVGDTVAKIPVINNKFKGEIKQQLVSDFYTIRFDNYSQTNFYFGSNDSLYISYKLYGTKTRFNIKGTRFAENIQSNNRRSYTSYEYYLKNNLNIGNEKFYMDGIYEDWQNNLEKLASIRTVDNIVPQEDYLNRQKKVLALQFLNYWKDFKKKRKTLYPNKPYEVSSGIKELEQNVSLRDASLLTDNNYLKYILNDLIRDDKREVPQEEKYFTAINELEPSLFKDRILYRQLISSMLQNKSISARDSMIDKYLDSFTKESYKKLIVKRYKNHNRLSKGEPAPNFLAFDRNGKSYTLNSFKGKLTIIDFWASWCGPCKREDPHFERKALAYKNKDIQFISMNVDENEKDWLIDIDNKGKSILQLRPNNIDEISKEYAIRGIPRFILIDDKGKFISSNFTRPSNNVFDELVNLYLKNVN